jgi:uncharacterized protein (DUF1015 family)
VAIIRPFSGIRYNPARVPDLGGVVTQPYDRISRELRARYLQQHPNSFVQLILGDSDPHEAHSDNPYQPAAALYRRWLQEGVLVPDGVPALYVYHQTFGLPDGQTLTRKAVIAALQLTPFDEGTVLPHERTLSAPKADRLNLFRATHANFEPVFLLYPDHDNQVNDVLNRAIEGKPPAADVRESCESDVRQQLWVVADADVIEHVRADMAPKRRLIIADGHHRYETALDYRAERRAAQLNAPADAQYDYVLAALVSLDDPGVTILPTHRLVHSYSGMTASEIEAAAAAYFTIQPAPDRAGLKTVLQQAGEGATAFALVTRDRQTIWSLRDGRIMEDLAPQRTAAWRQLDVAILHQVVLEKLMGLTPESIMRQENLQYLREAERAFRALDGGEAQFLFLLNPTRIAQVRACAEAGEKMPQKSTDFYPKMISGLVLRDL